MIRWLLHDEDGVLEDWSLPVNPKRMDAPEQGDRIEPGVMNLLGMPHDTAGQPEAFEWSFEGTVYSLVDLELLTSWVNTTRLVTLTDHFSQVWRIHFTSLNETRASTRQQPERHHYVAKAYMMGAVT